MSGLSVKKPSIPAAGTRGSRRQVADGVGIGAGAERGGQELVLPTERPAVHDEPRAVGVADHVGGGRQVAGGVPGDHHVLAQPDAVGVRGDPASPAG